MEESEESSSGVKGVKPASQSLDVSESVDSKRINKRKQRFPTKQTTETPKSVTDIVDLCKEKGEKIQKTNETETIIQTDENNDCSTTCVVKVSKKGKDCGEVRSASKKGNKINDNDKNMDEEVTPRRSSRAPKKKKMFGFDDSEDEDEVPAVKKSKKSLSRIGQTSTNRISEGDKNTKLNQVDIKVTVKEEPHCEEEEETVNSEKIVQDDTEVNNRLKVNDRSNKIAESEKLDKIKDNNKVILKEKHDGPEDIDTQKQNQLNNQISPNNSNILAEDRQGVPNITVIGYNKTKVVEDKNTKPLLSMKEELQVINQGRKEAPETEINEEKGKEQGKMKIDGSEDPMTDAEISDFEENEDINEDSDSNYEIDEGELEGDSDDDALDIDLEHQRKKRKAIDNDIEKNASAGNTSDQEDGKEDIGKKSQVLDQISSCSLCESTFSCKRNLKRHMLTIHSENLGFKCSECDNIFRSEKAFDRHKTLHNENSYKCGVCEKSFVSLGQIQRHVRETHKGMLPFRCEYENCEKRFSNSSNRSKHIAAVHLNIRRHKCSFCPKMFKNSSAMRVHMYSAHEEQFQDRPKFECEVCHKVFGHRLKLKIHETVHSAIRPFACKFECGRTFRLKSNKIKHERVHENIKPYKCDVCEQAFSRKVYLETHQYKHTGIKKFQCPTCNKTFTQKGNLDIHMKIHSDDRELHVCLRCSKPFSNKSNLTKHMQTVCKDGGRVNKRYLVQHPGAGTTNHISTLLQEWNEFSAGDTVYVLQDENKGNIKKFDKACGTDEVHVQKKIETRDGIFNQTNLIVEGMQPSQNAQFEKMILTDLKPKISHEVMEETQCNGPEEQTVYIENAGTIEGPIPAPEEIVQEVAAAETVTFTELGNVNEVPNALAKIINPTSSENVEYEIVSSGLDGVEEGILKEFLSKWNQQITPAGTTVILDVQNHDNPLSADGSGLADSVQYIVTVKDQE